MSRMIRDYCQACRQNEVMDGHRFCDVCLDAETEELFEVSLHDSEEDEG